MFVYIKETFYLSISLSPSTLPLSLHLQYNREPDDSWYWYFYPNGHAVHGLRCSCRSAII